MDLERIKQNLRLRSGRSRKARQRQQQPAPQLPPGQKPGPQLTRSTTRDQFSQTENADDRQHPKVSSKGISPEQHRMPDRQELRLEEGLDKAASYSTIANHDKAEMRSQGGQLDHTEQQQACTPDASDDQDFDLRPPKPKIKRVSLESTSELLFSAGHLNAILHDQQSIGRFTVFLNKFRPEYQPLILRYLETQKAIKAVEYANAVAAGATRVKEDTSKDIQKVLPDAAAKLDSAFEDASNAAFKALVGTALPMYITYSLVKIVSRCLVDEITGKQSGIMQNMIGGLSEVFCITDPKQADNPIIYASEEFYRYTGYGSEDVIGQNCRFLQGPKTLRDSPRRLKEAIDKGEETCEALLNYRRDGCPFINLLMIAPLHDNKGEVKYNIGAQIDASGLVENGRGLDFFARYLAARQTRGRHRPAETDERKQKQLDKLRELSEMFDLEESAIVQTHSRASSLSRNDDNRSVRSLDRPKSLRRLFVAESGSDTENEDDAHTPTNNAADAWELAQEGPGGRPSGGLPGVYDTYMLIRPAPSLRIIFVSRKLQRLVKTIQAPFLSHLTASTKTLTGLKESFVAGVPVSAKVSFSAEPNGKRDGIKIANGYKHEDGEYGKACWISATPLLGGDDRPGVWMVVFVEKSKANNIKHKDMKELETKMLEETRLSSSAKRNSSKQSQDAQAESITGSKSDLPIKPVRLNSQGPIPAEDASNKSDKPGSADFNAVEVGTKAARAEHSTSEDLSSARSAPTEKSERSKAEENEMLQDSAVRSCAVADQTESDRASNMQNHKASSRENPACSSSPPLSRQRSDTGYESTPKFQLDLGEQGKLSLPPNIPADMMANSPGNDDRPRDDVIDHNGSDENNDTPIATRINTRISGGGDRGIPDIEKHSPRASKDEASQETFGHRDKVEAPESELDDNKDLQSTTSPESATRPGLVTDYLSHPGSTGRRRRTGTEEFGRALKAKGHSNSDDSWDSECLKSPYSVD